MQCTLNLHLFADRPLVMADYAGREMAVISGTVWLTAEAGADVFLAAGSRYPLPCRGITLVEAVRGSAEIRIEAAASRTAWSRIIHPVR